MELHVADFTPGNLCPRTLVQVKKADFGNDLDGGDSARNHRISGDNPAEDKRVNAAGHAPADGLHQRTSVGFVARRRGHPKLALTRFQARILLVDDVKAAFTTHHAAVFIAFFRGFQ